MTGPQHAAEADDARLSELMAWRQQLVDAGKVSRTSLKEAHLRQVLRFGGTDVEQIRAMLPGSAAEHADELARLLDGLGTPAQASPPTTGGERGRHHADSTPPVGDAAVSAQVGGQDEALIHASDFAEFTFGDQHPEPLTITPRRRRDAAGKPAALELSWPPHQPERPDTVLIYRLVSGEDTRPYSPDRADLLTVTTATSGTDDRPPVGALRYYQVWVNVGTTRADALAAQPIKHAETVLVSPVQDFSLREDNGRVIGQWSVTNSVRVVYVSRVPIGEVDRVGLQHRILADRDNLDGFVDAEAARGERFRYVVRAAAPVDGVLRLSESVEADVEISAVLTAVEDLTIANNPDGESVDLRWTAPPAGRVVIYRSQNGPQAGAEDTEIPEVALEQVGLTPEMRLTQPSALIPDTAGPSAGVMAGVTWPQGWSRAYLTPVTLLAGRALVGRSLSSVRTAGIRDVELAEYCNKQVLTFDWPNGAAAVEMHIAPKGYDARNGLSGQSKEISREDYDRYGGMQLTARELPIAGCSVHLSPVAFSGGRRVTGAVCSLEYAGLLRLQYAVRLGHDPDGWPAYAHVAMRAEVDVPGSPAFVLVHNRERIPLSANDGEAIDAAPLDANGRLREQPSKELRWSQLTTHGAGELWAANLRGRRGWIRLFVNTHSPDRLRTIALLDPPVETLYLSQVTP